MKTPPSRQGKRWSKYRCKCNAPQPCFCICAEMEYEKPVTWEGLEQRGLEHLFSPGNPERLTLHSMPARRSNLFIDRVFTGDEFEIIP